MTAEIAVLNQEAVALAADSAVTGQAKIFTSANKIFALSKYHPVAVMVYDSAQFLHVPWETIVKTYREVLADRSFPTLREHAAHFLGFFDQVNPLFPAQQQEECNRLLWESAFVGILVAIDRALEERTSNGEELTEDDIASQADQIVQQVHDVWGNADNQPSLPEAHGDAVVHAYEVDDLIESVFEHLPLSSEARGQLRDIASGLVSSSQRNEGSPFHSGLVIAGYGGDEYFPRLFEFEMETVALNRLKYAQHRPPVEIGPGNRATIRPFAQSEQVATFMEGIDGSVRAATLEFWSTALPDLVRRAGEAGGLDEAACNALAVTLQPEVETLVQTFDDSLGDLQFESYVAPIIRVVAMMPKDELAAMAESLVNLTSFKRKVTEEAETVGGPIDVAVISKGDGLIWVKRKHYFDPALNQQFFANYYRERTT